MHIAQCTRILHFMMSSMHVKIKRDSQNDPDIYWPSQVYRITQWCEIVSNLQRSRDSIHFDLFTTFFFTISRLSNPSPDAYCTCILQFYDVRYACDEQKDSKNDPNISSTSSVHRITQWSEIASNLLWDLWIDWVDMFTTIFLRRSVRSHSLVHMDMWYSRLCIGLHIFYALSLSYLWPVASRTIASIS